MRTPAEVTDLIAGVEIMRMTREIVYLSPSWTSSEFGLVSQTLQWT